jgi:Uma2 family endonuclease
MRNAECGLEGPQGLLTWNEERSAKLLSEKASCTYADYATWPDDERWELIDGHAYAMTPSQSIRHQQILGVLCYLVGQYFEGKPCQVLAAPVDVLLPQGEESDDQIDTVVQPDLLVVCDPAKVERKFVRGAPDLVIEILSESTAPRDLGKKLDLYERHGVRC